MYFQKDYVLRMIEMIGELARRFRGILREQTAWTELEQIAQRACGLPLDMLRMGDTDMLHTLLDDPQRYLAAELLLIDIEIAARKMADEELLPRKAQALALLRSLPAGDYLRPACERARALLSGALDTLPVASLLDAADLLERGGFLSGAEDALYVAFERDSTQRPLLVAYYDRLSLLDDATLTAGGLNRAEIAEGRAAL